MQYRLFMPKQAVGANLVYFDAFNASGSPFTLQLLSVMPVVSGAAAVTGTLGVDLFLTRTSAIGTGGTAATVEGTSLTAATFTCTDGSQPINNGVITARLTPTGGATAGAVISFDSVFTEETNAGTYTPAIDLVTPQTDGASPIVIPPGTGFRVVQGSVASVGNIGFNIVFALIQK